MLTNIYSISAVNGEPRYIGKTVKKLSVRLGQHLRDAKKKSRKNRYVYNWLRKLIGQGGKPHITLLQIRLK